MSTVYVGLLGPDIWQYLSGQGLDRLRAVSARRSLFRHGPWRVRRGRRRPPSGPARTGCNLPCSSGFRAADRIGSETFATASRKADVDTDVLAASCRDLVTTDDRNGRPNSRRRADRRLSSSVDHSGWRSQTRPAPNPPERRSSQIRLTAERGQASCVVSVAGDRQLDRQPDRPRCDGPAALGVVNAGTGERVGLFGRHPASHW